jgi:DNA-binding response OmpR family regulator
MTRGRLQLVFHERQQSAGRMRMPEDFNILIVEDSPSQALQFQLTLQRAGYRVHVVADGAAGWRYACAQLPQIILLDVDLPGMDGFQVLARLKRDRATAGIPVLMLTHREHISSVTRAIELGADDYLFKDEALQQIGAAVEQILQSYRQGV